MSEMKMLVINHIEPIGLIAKDGSELAKVFCNTYLIKATNEIADQSDSEALHFLGGVAGHALTHMFSNLKLEQLDSVLGQLRTYVIQTQGERAKS